MNDEALKYKGRLSQKKIDASGEKIKCEDLLSSLRHRLDPTVPIEELDSESIQGAAFNFCLALGKYKSTILEISNIEKVLGRG